MKNIRIIALHLAFGGVEKAIVNMANLFIELGYPVEIICVYRMPNSPAFPLNAQVQVTYLLKNTPNRQQWKECLKKKRLFQLIKESIKAIRILLHKKYSVYRAIRNIQDGIIITTRHEDTLVLSKYGRSNVFKIAQLHHDHQFNQKLLKACSSGYTNIDVFTLLTPQLADEMREIMKKNQNTRVICIPNFLEQLPEKVTFANRKKIIIAVGRLNRVKGFSRLIEIFSQIHSAVPDWKLLIVGEGEERSSLETLIQSFSLENQVMLTGQKSSTEIEELMNDASIYAMTSHSEGLPFVLLEALSCGLPIIAYDVRVGPRAIVEDRVNGFLIPEHDQQKFIIALLDLIQNDNLRQTMSNHAYARAKDFSKDRIKNQWNNILKN